MHKPMLFLLFIIFLILVGIGRYVFYKDATKTFPVQKSESIKNTKQTPTTQTQETNANAPRVQVIATSLEVPWAIAFLPDRRMLVTERPGRVRIIDANGNLQKQPIATFTDVYSQTAATGEDGLLGAAVDPKFNTNHYVFFYYTYQDINGNTLNRVVRYEFQNNQLTDRKVIVDKIPGNYHHDGGRLEFGPDGYLYITTGDSLNPPLAQNKDALAGKILRVTDEGSPAPDNPFHTIIYSYGHRNPQGLAWNSSGQLYETEHGDSAHDEINMIKPGLNYGWPIIQGDQTRNGMVTPLKNSEDVTWAPSAMTYLNGAFYFGALKGAALYKMIITGNDVQLTPYFQNEYGRIRTVTTGPDGLLYLSTSNRDGRTTPRPNDDQILRVNPAKL